MRRVLVVGTGSPTPEARQRYGDFSEWFERLLAPEVVVIDAVRAEPFPGLDRIGGVLVTGSLSSLTRPEPWMERLGRWLLGVARSTPVLGVCFGHQLLARALGGAVERNLAGPEVGTRPVELTPEGRRDPLFAGLASPLLVQESHEDHVTVPPPGATLLATNPHSPVQAFAVGPHIRAVQFHPEFDALRSRALCREGRAALEAARPGLADAALATIRDTPEAERILANWVRVYVGA
jgi:GMP synthase (glutamine-hydrolysing)